MYLCCLFCVVNMLRVVCVVCMSVVWVLYVMCTSCTCLEGWSGNKCEGWCLFESEFYTHAYMGNLRFKAQNTKHKTQNTKHKTQNTKHKEFVLGVCCVVLGRVLCVVAELQCWLSCVVVCITYVVTLCHKNIFLVPTGSSFRRVGGEALTTI